jgi:hypothetical protein
LLVAELGSHKQFFFGQHTLGHGSGTPVGGGFG